MSFVQRALALGLVSGSVLSCASQALAQATLQPQAFFWEPPRTFGPIHPKFAPMIRVVLREPDTTGSEAAAYPGPPMTAAELNAGIDSTSASRDFNGPANTPLSALALINTFHPQGWLGVGKTSVFVQNAKTVYNYDSSLLGSDTFPSPLATDARSWEKVDVDVDNIGGSDFPFSAGTPETEDARRRQPWMIAGRSSATAFWDQFAAALLAAQQAGTFAPPARAHLDIEPLPLSSDFLDLRLTSAFDIEDAYLLYALPHEDSGHKPLWTGSAWTMSPTASTFSTNENRWNNLPVPGFGLKTLRALWQGTPNQPGVNIYFGNRLYPLVAGVNYNASGPNGPDAMFPDGPTPGGNDNRAVYMWYAGICQKALSHAHTSSVIDVMKSKWSGIKGGNYEQMTISPGQYDFGWHQPVPASGTAPSNFARVGQRGYKDSGQHGYNLQTLSSGPEYQWLNYNESERIGDFSSPVLYAVGSTNVSTAPGYWGSYLQNDPYLPGYPLDDRWPASMRWHRWTLESIIASEGERGNSSPWLTVAPWIPTPGNNGTIQSAAPYTMTADDTNRQLALLRSKAIPELLVFNPRPGPDGYADFEKLYRQVYDPYITLFQIRDQGTEAGTTPNCGGTNPPSNCPAARIERVVDTNPRFTGTAAPFTAVPHTFDLSITRISDETVCPTTGCPTGQTKTKDLPTRVQMKAQLGSSASAVPLNERLRLNLELDAILTVPPTATMASVNPVILVKFEVIPESAPAFFLEFTPEPINGVSWGASDLPLHAPTEDLSPTQRRWTMRRTFDIEMPRDCPKKILRSDGSIEMYITVRALARNAANRELGDGFPVGSSLEVRHDLVQPIRAYGFTTCNGGGGTIGGGFGGGEQGQMNLGVAGENVGANIDGSGGADIHDLTMFLNGLAEGNSIADVNNDEQIDGNDVEQFMTDYTDPQ